MLDEYSEASVCLSVCLSVSLSVRISCDIALFNLSVSVVHCSLYCESVIQEMFC